MTKLETLIQQLCPDGVEHKKLEEILIIKNGKDYKHLSTGQIPVYGSGGIMTYVDTAVYDKPSVLIPRKGSLDKLYYVDTPFWNVDTIFYTVIDTMQLVPKYLFYCLSGKHLEKLNKAGGVPSLTQATLSKVFIPVPPLEIQREIVRILDSYTSRTAELQAQLAAELTARKQQYAYYKDFLSTFPSETTMRELGTFATVTKLAGYEFTKYVRYSESGTIIALRGLNVKNGHLELNNVKYIDTSDFSKLSRSKLHIEDMLFTYVGTIGQVALVDAEDKYYLAPNVALIRINPSVALPRFIMHYFQSHIFWKTQINKLLQSSSMQNIPMEKIRKFQIPVPPLAEQERIVAILDRFDALCNDLTSGLPAEIEARQKQYEYYRDKLLTFKEMKQ